jgi:hypothetical protein
MPFIDTRDGDASPGMYNVISAVGQDCPNKRDEVRLVQTLLKLFYQSSGFAAPKGQMVVDGLCGPITKNWILKFQLDIRHWGNAVMADKRVDRIRDHQDIGSISHTMYTLVALNRAVQSIDPSGWMAIPGTITMSDPASVPAPGYDYVPEYVPTQKTSPGGIPGHTPTSPARQSTSPK